MPCHGSRASASAHLSSMAGVETATITSRRLLGVDISTVMATRVTSSKGHEPSTSADGIAIERAPRAEASCTAFR